MIDWWWLLVEALIILVGLIVICITVGGQSEEYKRAIREGGATEQ